jgi:hypothetical protein
MFDSVNHTRFLKEDHLPDCGIRDNQVKKGDHVELKVNLFALICSLNWEMCH